MTTKTIKNTDTENKETKTTTKTKSEKPKVTPKKKTESKEVQTSELPKEEKATVETTAVAVPEEIKPETTEPKEDVFSKDFVKQAVKEKNKIAIEYGKVEQSYWNIASSIHWLYDNNGFIPLGYQNIYDLAKQEFGIARSTTCGFINIVGRFGERNELGNFTGKIDSKYEAYSSSKLLLLLDLTDEEIEKLPPTLSVREMKKKIKVMLTDSENTIKNISDECCESFDEESENFEITRQALITCAGYEDYQKKIDDIDDYITRALKAHPEARIEIVLVTARSEEEKAEEKVQKEETADNAGEE